MRKVFWLLCLLMIGIGAAQAQDGAISAEGEVITAENFKRLRPIRVLGQSSLREFLWSPDGITLAAADVAGVWLYNAFDLAAEPRRFLHPTPGINQIAMNSDGTLLATTGYDGVLRLWDVASGEILREMPVSTGYTGVMRFSPDDALLLTNTDDGDYRTPDVIELWDTATWERITALAVEGPPIQAMFSPDGRQLVAVTKGSDVSSYGGKLRLWDVESALRGDADAGTILFDGNELNTHVRGAILTPDGEWIIAHIGERFERWHVLTGEQAEGQGDELDEGLLLPTPYANGITFVRGKNGSQTELHLWDFKRGGRIGTIPVEGGSLSLRRTQAVSSPDGEHYIVVTPETISRWSVNDLSQPQETIVYKPGGDSVDPPYLVFSPDGALLAFVVRGRIDLWDMRTSTLFMSLDTGTGRVGNVWFSADGTRLLATAIEVGRVGEDAVIWNLATGSVEARLDETYLSNLVSAPDWTLLAGTPNREPEFRLVRFDGSVTHMLYSQLLPGIVLAFSPDGRRLATIGDPPQFTPDVVMVMEVWDVETGDPVTTIGVPGLSVSAVTFDESGERIFFYTSGSMEEGVTIWDIANDQSLIPTPELMRQFRHPHLSLNGDVLLTETYALTVSYSVLPLTGESDTDTLRINNRQFNTNGAFSPDGRWLATAHYEGYVLLWGVQPDKP